MLSYNITGVAACMTPGDRGSDGNYVSDFYFMNGQMPDADILSNISSTSELVELFSEEIIYKFTGLNINTIFSFGINERIFKRTPIDALPFNSLRSGEIGWCVVVMPNDKIIFTDSIGLWDDQEAAITISTKTCVEGEENIFKDFNLVIRDKSTFELFPNGLFGEGGPLYGTDESFDPVEIPEYTEPEDPTEPTEQDDEEPTEPGDEEPIEPGDEEPTEPEDGDPDEPEEPIEDDEPIDPIDPEDSEPDDEPEEPEEPTEGGEHEEPTIPIFTMTSVKDSALPLANFELNIKVNDFADRVNPVKVLVDYVFDNPLADNYLSDKPTFFNLTNFTEAGQTFTIKRNGLEILDDIKFKVKIAGFDIDEEFEENDNQKLINAEFDDSEIELTIKWSTPDGDGIIL